MKFFRKDWLVRSGMGLVSMALGACSSAMDWLDEDPAAGADGAPGRSAREIVASLGSADVGQEGNRERPAKPDRRAARERVHEDAENPEPPPVQTSAPAMTKQDPQPRKLKLSEAEIDLTKLDLSGKFPTARTVEGREGFVHSPYDERVINVKGLNSGSLVADPRFRLEERKYFRLP